MGKIKTQMVKRLSLEIYEKYHRDLTTDFEKNKQFISRVLEVNSKKILNVVAGYLTKLKKKEEV